MKNFTLFLAYSFISFLAGAQAPQTKTFQFKNSWVDSVYKTLSLEQKIGQLYMVAAYSGGEKANQDWVQDQINKYNIGGLIFMQGTPEAQIKQTNHYQQSSKLPLLIAMDAEWGLGMRLTGVKDLPKQMTIGASRDTALMYRIGTVIAEQCKRLGVHINFAPSIDINNNPKNPVIGFRSFSADKELVATLGISYTKALQDNNIMACAKHFPGHGDVTVDSHEDLPLIPKNKAELQTLEFYPFQKLINAGVKSIMIAHLNLPLLDTQKVPSTLSYPIVTGILKNEMKFDGLIFTDALNMKGITNYYSDGEIELKAFLAGNDILLFSQDLKKGIDKLSYAYKSGIISEDRLSHSVKKILGAKFDKNLQEFQPINVDKATEDLNKAYQSIMEATAIASLTLQKGNATAYESFPKAKNKVIITFNASADQLKLYKAQFPKATYFNVDNKTTSNNLINFLNKLPKSNNLLVSLHKLSRYPGSNNQYGYTDDQIKILKHLSAQKEAKFIIFGVPYMAQNFCNAANILVTYEDHDAFLIKTFSFLHKDMPARGIAPVVICQ